MDKDALNVLWSFVIFISLSISQAAHVIRFGEYDLVTSVFSLIMIFIIFLEIKRY